MGLHDEYAPAPGAHAQSGQEVQNDYRSGDDAQAPSVRAEKMSTMPHPLL